MRCPGIKLAIGRPQTADPRASDHQVSSAGLSASFLPSTSSFHTQEVLDIRRHINNLLAETPGSVSCMIHTCVKFGARSPLSIVSQNQQVSLSTWPTSGVSAPFNIRREAVRASQPLAFILPA